MPCWKSPRLGKTLTPARRPPPASSDEDGGGTDSDDDDPEAVAAAAAALARPAPRPPPPSAPPATPAAAAAAPTPPSLSRNGSVVGCSYCWSQAADEATLSVFCPPGTRAKDVSVRLVDAAESFSVSRPLLPPHAHLPPRLLVSLRGAPLFDHQLAYAVERPTPGGGGGEVGGGGGDEGGGDDDASRARAAAAAAAEPPDWEIVDDEPAEAAAGGRPPKGRCVRVFLRKRSPAAGVVVWWARFAAGEPAIDTASISDRARGAARAGAARAAWAEAEAAFKAKVAAHKAGPEDDRLPVEVDADDD